MQQEHRLGEHLQVLRQAGLVTSRREGTSVHYRLAAPEVFELWRSLRTLARARLAEVERLATAYLGARDQLEPVTREELARRLAATDAAAVLKLGRTFERVRGAMEDAGRGPHAWYVERASTERQRTGPLRAVDGFSQALLEDEGERLTEDGRDLLHRLRAAATRMGQLIDDLLTLSRVTRAELRLAARNHGMPLEALRYPVTPVGLHYLLIHYDIPAVDPSTWRLEITGAVERPLSE